MTSTGSDREPSLRRVGLWIANALAAIAIASVVPGCGGSDPPDQTDPPSLPALTGTVVGADVSDPSTRYAEPTAKGATGTPRVANASSVGLDYQVRLSGLTGPFAVNAYFENGLAQRRLVTLAIEPGVANATVLTHLTVAQLYGLDPESAFSAYDADAAAKVSAETLGAAQAGVRSYLRDELGLSLDAAVGDFMTTPFRPVAGDPMYDAILAVLARAQARGLSFPQLVEQVAGAARLCLLEKITVAIDGVPGDFCPQAKSAEPREGDGTLLDYRFTDRRGNALTLEVRGDQVLAVRYTSNDGISFRCSASSCGALQLGAPADDLTRRFAFETLSLRNGSRSAILSGSLLGAIPGIALPILPCTANAFYVLSPDRSVSGNCAGPDDYGVGVGSIANYSGADRLVYSFNAVSDAPVAQQLELVVQGDTVIQALLYTNDANTGVNSAPYLCRGGACAGITIGPVRVDGSAGFNLLLRDIRFQDTALAAVGTDGSLSESDTVRIRAALVGGAFEPVVPAQVPLACASAEDKVVVTPSDGAAAIDVCVPTDPMGYVLTGTLAEGEGLTLFVQNLLADGFGNSASGDAVNVRLDGAANVSGVRFVGVSSGSLVQYGCEGAACSGVAGGAPDVSGARTVSLDAVVLTEIGSLGIPGDRSVRLDGRFAAPPP